MPMPKRKAYTVREKLDLVIRIRKGESQCKVSREMHVPESTLRGWLKDEVKLQEFLINVCAASVNSYAHVPLFVSRLLFSMSITHGDASYSQPIVTYYCRFVFHKRVIYSIQHFNILKSIQHTLMLIFYSK